MVELNKKSAKNTPINDSGRGSHNRRGVNKAIEL